ncbi:DNA invertase Pin-like site-specific DNA recombinase [Acetoanaerobium pronyense]|uniref:DNA invertase Pin-like site-specific DNA recombinase n=1 Tax=Acetoanaerobium pronyense TaxID=1482736 RepID=A0ABS4KMX2_9FIRM|nr:recombinase family protein [Acetoanaerobium pronyense]MBP2028680.1 DNA invertase Pin-like site-specific DNA recombinase [Acetoanaerobium pronyense]
MKKITKIEGSNSDALIKSKRRVAAYCRVSTDSNEQLISLEAQKSHYEKYIKSNPEWEYVGLYYDEGISGTKKEKRSELLRMLSDCEDGKIDLIITKSISRLARNTTDCLEMVRKLVDLGVYIYFEKENINTEAMESELMLSILSGLAESESISISENNKWSIQRRFQNGTFKISYPPYGYQNIDGHMVINPKQAEVVKYIFSEALSGKGTQKIADGLNYRGIPSKKGDRWIATTIRGILKNEKYTGDAILQKTYTDSNFNRHINNGEKNMYLVKNHHEPIISHEVFDAVEAVMKQRAKEKGIEKHNSKNKNRYVFSSKIICSECGSTFKRRIHSSGSRKYIAWCCNKHIKEITECSMQFIRDEDIKMAFVTVMNKLIFGQKFILRPLIQGLRNQNNTDNFLKIKELEVKIENNIEQSQTLTALMTKGYLEPSLYTKEKNALETERAILLAEKERLTRSVNGNLSKVEEVSKLLKFATKSKMLTTYEDEFFKNYVDRIIVYSREEIGFEFKFGIILRERMGK